WLNGSRDNTNGTGILRIDDVRLDGVIKSSLSINDLNQNNKITLYPNPASNGDVTIQTDLRGTKQIEMYDINGRQVLKTSTIGDRINVDNFNAGLYLVRISIDDASTVSKLIIN
ncbi:T9SS type A sorting domain-containing protein, partial [Paucihalobacter sp.]|uniref:T9SS type A sorting domain-containing protein n=1 Tax=Paucihalobacter sp. TaxID=2850405 RepID=UPI002FE1B019